MRQDDRVPVSNTPVPTRFTKYLRVFLPWQIYRFIKINYNMIKVIWKSHSQRY